MRGLRALQKHPQFPCACRIFGPKSCRCCLGESPLGRCARRSVAEVMSFRTLAWRRLGSWSRRVRGPRRRWEEPWVRAARVDFLERIKDTAPRRGKCATVGGRATMGGGRPRISPGLLLFHCSRVCFMLSARVERLAGRCDSDRQVAHRKRERLTLLCT